MNRHSHLKPMPTTETCEMSGAFFSGDGRLGEETTVESGHTSTGLKRPFRGRPLGRGGCPNHGTEFSANYSKRQAGPPAVRAASFSGERDLPHCITPLTKETAAITIRQTRLDSLPVRACHLYTAPRFWRWRDIPGTGRAAGWLSSWSSRAREEGKPNCSLAVRCGIARCSAASQGIRRPVLLSPRLPGGGWFTH